MKEGFQRLGSRIASLMDTVCGVGLCFPMLINRAYLDMSNVDTCPAIQYAQTIRSEAKVHMAWDLSRNFPESTIPAATNEVQEP